MKKIALTVITLYLSLILFGCSDQGFMKEKDIKILEQNPTGTITFSYIDSSEDLKFSTMEFELFYDRAPITVINFVNLADDNFYNGTLCTYGDNSDEDGFIDVNCYTYEDESYIQKTVDYFIMGEFENNGWEHNDTEHTFGTMTMIKDDGNDTASAYFKIILNENASYMNGNYAAFGRLLSVDSTFFSDFLRQSRSFQSYDFKVISITVDTHGEELGSLRTLNK